MMQDKTVAGRHPAPAGRMARRLVLGLVLALSVIGCAAGGGGKGSPAVDDSPDADAKAGQAGNGGAGTGGGTAGVGGGGAAGSGGSGGVAQSPDAGAGGALGGAGAMGADAGDSRDGAGVGGDAPKTSATDPGTEGNGDFIEPAPYKYTKDSERQLGVPQGTVTSFDWNNSKVYPGSKRKVYVYVPKQYDGMTPAPLMVFQDGSEPWAYLNGDYRPAIVLDNLIAKKEIPIMIALFIDHSDRRNAEYDAVNPTYGRFVIEEIIPEISKTLKITQDPEGHAAAGESSGGTAAFGMGWFHPDYFHRIMTHSGSFVNYSNPGADTYKDLVRTEPVKPLRVYMNDDSHDINDGPRLNWPVENKALAAALKARGYAYRFTFGDDVHGGFHGAANFPESMRWLWKGYPK